MSKHKSKTKMGSFGKTELTDRVGLIYARVSSKRQEIEGTGLQSQEGNCKRLLSQKNIPFDRVFPDSFTGGGDFMKRPAMRELLAYIDANPHKKFVVVFDDLKRFARDTEFHLKLRTAFKVRDVLLLCPNYNFEDTPEGVFVETVFAAQNQLDREQNKRQVIQKQKSRLLNGYRAFPAVKGYMRVKDVMHGKIDIKTKDAIYVKEALEGFASKRFIHKIDGGRFLQEKNIISKKQGAEKAIETFDKMLREVFYAGYIEYRPWEVSRRLGHHQPLISIETFEKNQARLKQSTTTFVRQDIREGFELRGLVNCSECLLKMTGAPSTSKTGKKHDYYKCPNKDCLMYGKSIRTASMHNDFADILKKIKPSQEVVNLTIDIFEDLWKDLSSDFSTNKERMMSEKKLLEEDIEKLTKLAFGSTNEIVIKQYEKQIEKVGLRIDEIDKETDTIYDFTIPYRTSMEEVLNVLKSPYSVWESYNPTQKQRFFSFIFEANLVYSKKEGYRTPNYALPIRIFEEISNTNTLDVELGGIEPPCKEEMMANLHV